MATPELGQKQICPNCQAKFYDLNRRPARCPKCANEFDPEEAIKLRTRRGRPAGYAADEEESEDQVADKSAEGDEEEEDGEASTPEIDEEGHEPILTPDDEDEETPVDPTEESGMSEAGDDDVLDEDDDSVPFIEDEDDDSFEDEIGKPPIDDE